MSNIEDIKNDCRFWNPECPDCPDGGVEKKHGGCWDGGNLSDTSCHVFAFSPSALARTSLVLQRVEPPPENKCMGLPAPSPGQVNDLHHAEIA